MCARRKLERRAALGALRELKLECAKQFIQQRSAGLHPTADYFIEERYETPEGDFCNVRFDRTALRRVTGGVHAVFEALKRAVFNAEIVLSEASGNITIREDDDMDEMDNFSQMKLVTETTQGILVENNLVHFSDYIQEDGEQSYALATADFVNEDDLFPYRSHERIRRDATAEDDSEAYGADRHAAAALRGFAPCAGATPAKKKRIYKKRKATHTIRKEEKQALESEIQKLQKQLEMLKFKTLVENGNEPHSDKKQLAKGAILRETVQEQHLVLARAQAMLAGHSQQSLYRLHPTETTIRLGPDRDERMRTLNALRGPKLQEARRFLLERTKGLSPTAPYFQEERYDTMDGDYCIARFDVTPFRGAKGGVLEVFTALQQAIFNAEIIISESSGNITIREDDEIGDEYLSQMRFVSQTPHGVQLETNLVMFSDSAHFQEKDTCLAENGRYAIMASDFVDEDTRFPYRPLERIRRDSTTLTMALGLPVVQ
uniref:Uncharacterized protein n=1 Tax=Phytophthora ramorum TaxID=164328 RepID=H3HDD8_PHYRM